MNGYVWKITVGDTYVGVANTEDRFELLKQAASEETDEDIFYQDEENEDKDFDVYASYDCKEQAYYAGVHRGRTELAREVLEAFRQFERTRTTV